MATTMVPSQLGRRYIYTLGWTADGDIVIELPNSPSHRAGFTSNGVDGGGTLTWFVSDDNSNFGALGVALPATPDTRTVVSATAAGVWNIPAESLGHRYLKFTLASSTTPALAVVVNVVVI